MTPCKDTVKRPQQQEAEWVTITFVLSILSPFYDGGHSNYFTPAVACCSDAVGFYLIVNPLYYPFMLCVSFKLIKTILVKMS